VHQRTKELRTASVHACSPENLAALRHLLPSVSPGRTRPAATLPTGVAAIDEAGGGGLPLGGITEIVALAPSSRAASC